MTFNLADQLQTCTVRINIFINAQYRSIGTGFFVAPQMVVTCAHVKIMGENALRKRRITSNDDRFFIEWQGKNFAAKVIKCTDAAYPDLALLCSEVPEHPCVYINSDRERRDDLLFFGFPTGARSPNSKEEAKKFADGGEEILATLGGRARRGRFTNEGTFSFESNTPIWGGMSGSAILNERTGGVCGIVKATKSENADVAIGGRAIPVEEIWNYFSELRELNAKYHETNLVWVNQNANSKYTSFLLPGPFDWIKIPTGLVTLSLTKRGRKSQNQVAVADFQISKYPITNGQYQVFIDDPDGYANNRWWEESTAIRQWRARNQNCLPPKFDDDDLPRTNLSWFECIAFCRWISWKTGDNVNLPKESQWQRAAQGNSSTAYPWGENWIKNRCNHWTPPVTDQLTAVDNYPDGASIYGVYDLSGNIWEWCLDEFEPGKGERILRGGSFRERLPEHFRVDFRRGFDPFQRGPSAGFRIAKS